MEDREAKAILDYVEYNLLSLVERAAEQINDQDIHGSLYDEAYSLLQDLELTLHTQTLLDRGGGHKQLPQSKDS